MTQVLTKLCFSNFNSPKRHSIIHFPIALKDCMTTYVLNITAIFHSFVLCRFAKPDVKLEKDPVSLQLQCNYENAPLTNSIN